MIKQTFFFTLLFFSIRTQAMENDSLGDFSFNELFEVSSAQKQHALNNELYIACKKNETQKALETLKKGAETNTYHEDSDLTPLMHAAYHNNFKLVKALLEKKANVNAKSYTDDGSPLVYALYNSKNDPKQAGTIINLLIQHNAKLAGNDCIEIYDLAREQWNCDMNLLKKLIVLSDIPMGKMSSESAALKLQKNKNY